MENSDQTIIESAPQKTSAPKETPPKKHNQKKSPRISKGAAAGIGAGAAAVGAAAAAIPFFAYGGHSNDNTENPTVDNPDDVQNSAGQPSDNAEPHVPVASDLPVATCVNDDMTPDEAFAAARAEVGPGGIYYYHGHAQGTYYESEWNNMSPDDREDYWASVQHTHEQYGPSAFQEDDQPELELVDADEIPDMYLVDANGNDLPDAILDMDRDGVGDVLVVDIEVENGEVVAISDAYTGEFDIDEWGGDLITEDDDFLLIPDDDDDIAIDLDDLDDDDIIIDNDDDNLANGYSDQTDDNDDFLAEGDSDQTDDYNDYLAESDFDQTDDYDYLAEVDLDDDIIIDNIDTSEMI